MSKLERLLVPGALDLPDCPCGAEMHLAGVEPTESTGTEVRTYRCPSCRHELRLTVWRDVAVGEGEGLVSGL